MRTKRKRPTSNVRFYTFLVSVVVVIWLFGFIIGRFSVAANNQPCPTVSAQEIDSEEALTDTEPVYEWLDFKATAYCSCSVCCNGWAYNRPVDKYGNEIVLTASGERAVEGVTIAADWSVLPKGTILSCDQYRKYRDIVPKFEDDWLWTLTPWSCYSGNGNYVRIVDPAGYISSNYACNTNVVAPACKFSSSHLKLCRQAQLVEV